jgi:hypothetical protein
MLIRKEQAPRVVCVAASVNLCVAIFCCAGCVAHGWQGGKVSFEAYRLSPDYLHPEVAQLPFKDPPPNLLKPETGAILVLLYRDLDSGRYRVLSCHLLRTQGRILSYPLSAAKFMFYGPWYSQDSGETMGVIGFLEGCWPVQLDAHFGSLQHHGFFACRHESGKDDVYKIPLGLRGVVHIFFCSRARQPWARDEEASLVIRACTDGIVNAVRDSEELSDAQKAVVFREILQSLSPDDIQQRRIVASALQENSPLR